MKNGYVKICVTGKNSKLFLKKLLINRIKYNKFKQINYNKMQLIISYEDYLKISNKNTIYEISILKRYGFIKYVYFFKNNFCFLLSFLFSIMFLFLVSNICFEIDIIHNNKNLRNLTKEELKNYNIKEFRLIPNFNKRKEIIEKIIKNNKDSIEWMEIERKGSKLIIKLTERKLNKEEEQLPKRHIVAKKSGIIKKIEAQQGVIVKKINDYVTQGDVIISGDIIKDETVKGQVVSEGVVYAETWYKVNVEYPLYYEEIRYLDDVKNNYIIKFFNKNFSLKKNYTNSYLEKRKVLISDKIFPFEISVEKQRKIKTIKEKLNNEQAILKAEKLALEKINKKLDSDEYVISKKTLNFSLNEGKIVLDVFLKVYENITDYKNVDEILLNEDEIED